MTKPSKKQKLPPAKFLTVVKTKTKKAKSRTRRKTKRTVLGGPSWPRTINGMKRVKPIDDLAQYKLALTNPFAVEAFGCRVPDSYSFPTVTYHIRSNYIFTSDASGIGYGLFFPSPCFTCSSGFDGSYGTPGILRFTGGTNFSNNKPSTYLTSPTALANVMSEYRVVAWGLRFIAKDTAFASKGKIFVALVPTTANAPSWNTMETVTAASLDVVGEYACGVALTSLLSTIQNYPSCRVFSMQDLLRGEIMISGLPLNPSFYDFRGTTDRSNVVWNSGQILADEGVFNNTTGLVNATAGGRKDVASLRGGMAVAVGVVGCPGTANEFDVEVVYHLEGSPNTNNPGGPGSNVVPSSQQVLGGSTNTVERIIAAVRQSVPIVSFLTNSALADGATKGVVQAALSAVTAM